MASSCSCSAGKSSLASSPFHLQEWGQAEMERWGSMAKMYHFCHVLPLWSLELHTPTDKLMASGSWNPLYIKLTFKIFLGFISQPSWPIFETVPWIVVKNVYSLLVECRALCISSIKLLTSFTQIYFMLNIFLEEERSISFWEKYVKTLPITQFLLM